MDAALAPIRLPAPPVHARDLPLWRMLRDFMRSTISVWPERAFDEPVIVNTALGRSSILVNDPEGVRRVLAENAGAYGRHVNFNRVTRPMTGDGVLMAEGAAWRRQRRMLAPAFRPGQIGLLQPHFQAAAEHMLSTLHPGRVNLSEVLQATALDAASRALFSAPVGGRGARLGGLIRDYLAGPGRPNLSDMLARAEGDFSMFNLGRSRFGRAWLAEVGAIVAERRERGSAAGPSDMLDLLMEARDAETGEPLSAEEVRDQCATMLAAGMETTARAMFWTTYLLAVHAEEQARVRAQTEGGAKPGESQGPSRVRQAIFEGLRLYPPVAVLVRVATEADVVCGVEVPAGATIWIAPWVMHRHRRYWTDPTAFLPDRFEGRPQEFSQGGPYLPFGGGARICIGAGFALSEAEIVLSALFRRYRVTLDDDRPVTPVAVISTAPDIEPWFRLERV